MRVAVLSDVHGNAAALGPVLADIRSWGFDLLVSAGDVAAFGPQPEASLDMLEEAGALFVRGNNDRYLSTQGHQGSPGRDEADTAERAASLQWCRDRLGPARIASMSTWPVRLEINGVEIVHASPGDDEAGVWPEMTEEELCGYVSGVMVCGHTHLPFVKTLRCGIVANAGSVGWNLDGDTRASWAALQNGPGGWQAQIRRVPYDIQQALAQLRMHNPPWSAAVEHYISTATWRSPSGQGAYRRPSPASQRSGQ